MRTSTESEELTHYCERCESNGCTAIVFCDKCPSTCCIHLSGRVMGQLWCVKCVEAEGLDLEILSKWFWARDF